MVVVAARGRGKRVTAQLCMYTPDHTQPGQDLQRPVHRSEADGGARGLCHGVNTSRSQATVAPGNDIEHRQPLACELVAARTQRRSKTGCVHEEHPRLDR